MDRNTKIIEVGKHRVEVWDYITGKDLREYQAVMYGALKLKADGIQVGDKVTPKVEEIPANLLLELDTKMVKLLVVSVDGNKADVVEQIENLPANEYNLIVGELRGFFLAQ